MLRVPERSAKSFVATFYATEETFFTPSAARYRLHDRDSNTELIPWTSILSLNTRVTITIPASANRILNDANNREVKVLTVQSDFDTDSQQSEQLLYLVENLSGFSS